MEKIIKILLVAILILASNLSLHAQKADSTIAQNIKALKKERYGLKQFANETKLFVTLPLTWQPEDWFRVAFLGASTYLLAQVDQPLRTLVLSSNAKYYYSVPIVAGRVYGEWYTATTLGVGFTAYRLIAQHSSTETKKINLELIQSALYASAITEVLKIAVGRERPFENLGDFDFHPFNVSNYNTHSYPSGHTTLAFAISTVLARNTNSTALKILAYVPASLTIASRIYQDQHWVSDILTGAAIGYFSSTWVVNLHEPKKKQVAPPENFTPLPAEPKTPLVDKPVATPQKVSHFGLYGDLSACKMWVNGSQYELVRAGFSAGAFEKYALSNSFAIEPELLYSSRSIKQYYYNDYVKGNVTFNLNYIELPVLGVFNMTKNTNFSFGPYIAKLLSAKTIDGASDNTSINFVQQNAFQSFDYGLVFGIGVNTKKINYGIRYNYGLAQIGKNFDYNGQEQRLPDGRFSIGEAYISYNIF